MKLSPNDSILITSYDLKRLFVRHLPQLKILALILFCLTCVLLLLQKPQYLAKASFKHLDKQNDFSPFAKEIFKELSMPSNNAPIFSVMHSNRVLKSAIEQLGMHITADSFSLHPIDLLKRAIENLGSEWGRKPKDPDSFCFHSVSFAGEKPYFFYVKPLSSKSYQILDKQKKLIAQGELGKTLFLPEVAIVLHAFPKAVVQQKLYRFRIIPWISAVEQVRKAFEIRSHKLDKNVFTLYFKHADRNLASQFLNQVMLCYQDYYRKENEEICETQVAYLEKRQDELIKQFDSALKEHVVYLKKNIAESGCMGFSNELDILATPQNLFNSKLFDVDLELKRLESLYDNTLLSSKESSSKQSAEKPHLLSFKDNLELSLIDRDLEERRLPIREDSKDTLDCDALTLQSAKALYLQYTEKKDASETSLRERTYLRDRLNDPDFELSSLSTFLPDPVSISLAQHASDITLKIKDGENRTAREQERLKEELDTQKRFLHHHLTHMIELEKLQLKLLSHKIDSLQVQTLNLLEAEKHLLQEKITELNQKMSSLPDKWHRENLLLLKKELGSRIIGSMTQLVETKNLNQKLYQVSSKHLDLSIPPLKALPPYLIMYSLFSAFLGCFIYYIYKLCNSLIKGFPVSHSNLKFSGLFSCGVLSPSCGSTLQRLEDTDLSTLRGIVHFICSLEQKSCIALLQGENPDFSSHLAELLCFAGKKILLVHYSIEGIATPSFDQKDSEAIPGLFAYLQGKLQELPIRRGYCYDELPAGESWRHAADMLAHPRFANTISQLKEEYDYLLLQSNASPHTREAYAFMRIADAVIVSARDESQEDLFAYREWAEKKEKPCLAFVCFD